MADYNIYIHAINGGPGQYNPTAPWSQREGNDSGIFSQTQSQTGGGLGSVPGAITKAVALARNPDSVIATASNTALKALPWVAAAVACVDLGIKAYETALEFATLQSGDFARKTFWDNLKQGTSNIFHPVSSSIQSLKTHIEWTIQNQRRAQDRDLLGDSVINQYTGRGV